MTLQIKFKVAARIVFYWQNALNRATSMLDVGRVSFSE